MAELLWNSGHEEQHRKPEWMAIPSDTDVYLEAVETAKDTQTVAVNMAMTKERLISSGFYDLATAYQSVHVNY